jgi:hypothetical protein
VENYENSQFGFANPLFIMPITFNKANVSNGINIFALQVLMVVNCGCKTEFDFS